MNAEPPAGQPADGRPAVVIYRAPLFNPSETFVRSHALSLSRYRPLLAGLEDKGNVPESLQQSLYIPQGFAELARARLGDLLPLARRLTLDRPALVHAHFGTDGLAALSLTQALGVPLVTTLHGYDVSLSTRRLLLSGRLSWIRYALLRRRLFARGDLFLAVSDAVRRAAIALGFPAERTRTHYLGLDLARWRGGVNPEPGLILHVGRLVEKKGTSVLLEALGRLPEARLVVIGDGPQRQQLEQAAAQLGGRVRFLGARPSEEVADWLRRAWLLAAPSVTARDGDAEGLPTVIIEAAAAGVPAIATYHSGIPEAVEDGRSGFLVPERDADKLAMRIGEVLGSGELRNRMGRAARQLAETRFDLRRQTERLEDIYNGLVGQIRS